MPFAKVLSLFLKCKKVGQKFRTGTASEEWTLYPFYTSIQTCHNSEHELIASKTLSSSKNTKFCQNIAVLQNHCQLHFGSCVLPFNIWNTSYTLYQSSPSIHPASVSPVSAISIFKLGACSLTCAETSGHPQSKLGIGIAWRKFKEAHTILRPPSKSLHCSIQIQLKEVFFKTLSLWIGILKPWFVKKKCSP